MAYGNMDPDGMIPDDLAHALEQINIEDIPTIPGFSTENMQWLILLMMKANEDAGRRMGVGSMMAWCICVGVRAERLRRERLGRD